MMVGGGEGAAGLHGSYLFASPLDGFDLGRLGPGWPPWACNATAGLRPGTLFRSLPFHAASGNATLQAITGGVDMAKGEQRGNREAKKPKKEKPKTIAAAPPTKETAGSSGGSKK